MNEQLPYDIVFLDWSCHRENCAGTNRATLYDHEEKSFDTLSVDCMVCGTKSTLRCDVSGFYIQGHNEIGISANRATITSGFSAMIYPDDFEDFDENNFYPSEPWDNFETARDELNSLRQGSMGTDSKPLLRKVLFQQYITLLEAYLSDTFTRIAHRSDEAIKAVIMKTDTFKESTVSYRELAAKPNFLREKVIEHISNVSWHDMKRADKISETMLGTSIFTDDGHKQRMNAAVRVRHDLVHRNGKAKDGTSHTIDEESLQTLAVDVDNMARRVTEAYNGWLFQSTGLI